MAKQLIKTEEELNKRREERIKIVEKVGLRVENILTKKDTLEKEKCNEQICPICKNETKKLNVMCNSNNIGYRWGQKQDQGI